MHLSRQSKRITVDPTHYYEGAPRCAAWDPEPRVRVSAYGYGEHRHVSVGVAHPHPHKGCPMLGPSSLGQFYDKGYALDVKSSDESNVFVRVAPARGVLAEVQAAAEREQWSGFGDSEVARVYAADCCGLRVSDLEVW